MQSYISTSPPIHRQRTYTNYVINNKKLDEVDEIKDLGVTYDSLLLFDKHISEKVNKAYAY